MSGYRWMRRDPCVYCGQRFDNHPTAFMTWDHIEPRHHMRRGTDPSDNMVRACDNCNRRKGERSLLQFLVWRARGPSAVKKRCSVGHDLTRVGATIRLSKHDKRRCALCLQAKRDNNIAARYAPNASQYASPHDSPPEVEA